jgi:hypothetical protein
MVHVAIPELLFAPVLLATLWLFLIYPGAR